MRASVTNQSEETLGISRRGFIRLALLSSGCVVFGISGCALGEYPQLTSLDPFAMVNDWVNALSTGETAAFENLHSESVIWMHHMFRKPFYGRERIWQHHRDATGTQIEKIVSFGQDQSICLLINARELKRSHCFVFDISNDVIERAYGYSSQSFDLARSPYFTSIEISGDDTGLQDRLDAMDALFVDGVNNRDFSEQPLTESSIWFNFGRFDPYIGIWETEAEGLVSYVRRFPNVRHERIQTFGQGNTVCSHIAVSDPPGGSLCFVGVFQGRKIAELYEFRSVAKVNVSGESGNEYET